MKDAADESSFKICVLQGFLESDPCKGLRVGMFQLLLHKFQPIINRSIIESISSILSLGKCCTKSQE